MTDQLDDELSQSEMHADVESSWRRAFENSLVWIKPHQFVLWLVAIVLIVLLGVGTAFLMGIFADDGDDPPGQETAEPVEVEAVAPQGEPDPGPEVAAPEPAEAADDAGDGLLGSAAGVYRLQEQSLRVAVEPTVERFLSAEGAIVVEADGSVSGEYAYTYSETGLDTRTGSEFVTEVTADTTIDPTTTPRLEETDLGLSFDATMVVAFLADPSNGAPYTTTGASFGVTGLLDPASGLIELTVPGAELTLDFLR